MPTVYQAVNGRQLRVPIVDSANTAGLTLANFAITAVISGTLSSDPATDLSMTLDEVDGANLPGYYELLLTPVEVGLTYLRLVGNDTHEVHLQVAHEAQDIIGQAFYGSEGTLEISVQDPGGNPIEGVLVRVLTSTGSGLVARGTTDADGYAAFDLPTGDYYVRFSKSGYDFSSENPTPVTVLAWENVPPSVSGLLPDTASAGDSVVIRGSYFNGDNPTVLVEGAEVLPGAVSDDGAMLVFTVPSGLTSPAAIQVRKDDPDNVGSYLTSSTLYLTII